MEAAAIPLPSEDSTPPVTNMYLAMSPLFEKSFDLDYISGMVDAQGRPGDFDHFDPSAALQDSELFQALRPFEPRHRNRAEIQKEIALVTVNSDVLEEMVLRAPGQGRPRKIEGVPFPIGDDFDPVRIPDQVEVRNLGHEGRRGYRGILKSIDKNKERFLMTDQLTEIMNNTAELFDLSFRRRNEDGND